MMKRLAVALTALILIAPTTASAKGADITEAQANDIEISCQPQIEAFVSFLKSQGVPAQDIQTGLAESVVGAFQELPDLAEARTIIARDPNPNNNPPVFQNYFLCIMNRRFAWADGAPLKAQPPTPPSLGADEPPYGLKHVPPEAFKPAPEPDRHWLKAFMRTDGPLCDLEGCSHPFVEVHLTIDDAYGARTFDWSITSSDTHVFNYPAEAGRSYRFEVIHHPDEKFDCGEAGATSGVIDDRFATNADLAQPLFGVTCKMNGAGLEEYNRLKADKAASDALLQKG